MSRPALLLICLVSIIVGIAVQGWQIRESYDIATFTCSTAYELQEQIYIITILGCLMLGFLMGIGVAIGMTTEENEDKGVNN